MTETPIPYAPSEESTSEVKQGHYGVWAPLLPTDASMCVTCGAIGRDGLLWYPVRDSSGPYLCRACVEDMITGWKQRYYGGGGAYYETTAGGMRVRRHHANDGQPTPRPGKKVRP